jgi:hypothetical protein
MSSEDIYNNYLALAFQSNRKLIAYRKFSLQSSSLQSLKQLQYHHKNIGFFYSKLINLFGNTRLWVSCTNLNALPVYTRDVSSNTLNQEINFLKNNKQEIIKRLDLIDDKSFFNIDLKFINISLNKLDIILAKLKARHEQHAEPALSYYSIAS